jgi:hypothetical protein
MDAPPTKVVPLSDKPGFVGKRKGAAGPEYLDRGGEWIEPGNAPPEAVCTKPFPTRESAGAGTKRRIEKDAAHAAERMENTAASDRYRWSPDLSGFTTSGYYACSICRDGDEWVRTCVGKLTFHGIADTSVSDLLYPPIPRLFKRESEEMFQIPAENSCRPPLKTTLMFKMVDRGVLH